MITCPQCGMLAEDQIVIYNRSLRKQTFALSPVLPTCRHCGKEVAVTHTCSGGGIIVLTGSCGSGKSTIAEILAEKGFLAIDGDCVMQVVKHKTNAKHVEFNALMDEIACEIDLLSLFGRNIVLSHVIVPEDLDQYTQMLEKRNMRYKFFLLKPDYPTLVARCLTRTCHTSMTPEYWIKHFDDRMVFDHGVEVVDNTLMTADETTEHVLSKFNKECALPVDPTAE